MRKVDPSSCLSPTLPEYRHKLIYYRLQMGIQFLFEGIKRLFAIRLRKKDKQSVVENVKNGFPLFDKLPFDNLFFETVS
jgi:hypothetical protein